MPHTRPSRAGVPNPYPNVKPRCKKYPTYSRPPANVDELAELLVLEQGKPLEAAKGEVMGVSYLLQKAMDIKNEPEVYSDTPERRVEVRRVPIGVVACITPWNFPLFCSVQKWAPAVSSWFGIT